MITSKLKSLFLLAVLSVLFVFCSPKSKKAEVLYAEYIAGFDSAQFTMYADSTYRFHYKRTYSDKELIENYWGHCFLHGDTLIFHPFSFEFLDADTALVRNDFIEFLGGNKSFRLKARRSSFKIASDFRISYKNYSVFKYNAKRDGYMLPKAKPSILDQSELGTIDSILTVMIKKEIGPQNLQKYYKQCISIIDSLGEKVVWVNCGCMPKNDRDSSFQYNIVHVCDGGTCYFNVKINLRKRVYYDLRVNGVA